MEIKNLYGWEMAWQTKAYKCNVVLLTRYNVCASAAYVQMEQNYGQTVKSHNEYIRCERA